MKAGSVKSTCFTIYLVMVVVFTDFRKLNEGQILMTKLLNVTKKINTIPDEQKTDK